MSAGKFMGLLLVAVFGCIAVAFEFWYSAYLFAALIVIHCADCICDAIARGRR